MPEKIGNSHAAGEVRVGEELLNVLPEGERVKLTESFNIGGRKNFKKTRAVARKI